MSKVLFDEHPIVISPKLARIFGLEAAVFLQQIHYWAEHKRADPKRYSSSFHSGHAWVYKTHAEWLEDMPFLGSRSTFQRMIKTLKEALVLVVENHNQWEHDNTPWYRINYQVLEKLTEDPQVKMTRPRIKMTPPPCQNDPAPRVKMTPPPGQNDPSITRDYTETTKPETTQREGECARGAQAPTPKPKSPDDGFDVFWQAWPQKVAKVNAQKAWRKLKPSAELQASILQDIAARASQDKNWLEGFIPHAATYLNQRRWEDEILTSRPPSVPGNIGPRRPVETGDKRIRPGERDEEGLAYLAEEMRRRGLQTPYDAMFGEAGHG